MQRAGEAPYGLARLVLTTHSGTHVDAPLHFVAGGVAVDALPLEILIGKARVVEIQARERVERADLEALDLRDDLRVLLKTRMSGQLLKSGYQEDHVYLTGDAAHYLAQGGLKLWASTTCRSTASATRPTPRTTLCSAPASSSWKDSTSRRSSRASTT